MTGSAVNWKAVGAGAAITVITAPWLLKSYGFKAAGIYGGSWGAYLMKTTAIANGGGVPAGTLVSTLQSFGAAGIPTAVKAGLAATGGTITGGVSWLYNRIRGN